MLTMGRYHIKKAAAKTSRAQPKKSLINNSLTAQFGPQFFRATSLTIGYKELQNLAKANPFCAIAIDKIIKKVTKTDWIIKAKDEKKADQFTEQIKYVENLLTRPNIDSNIDTFKKLVTSVLYDVLTIDKGVTEKVRNLRGEIVNLYAVPGNTIKGNFDESGRFKEVAYSQFLLENYTTLVTDYATPDATFGVNDLLVFQSNPQNEVGKLGEGYSPIEMVITTITAGLQAMMYNTSYFTENNLPPAIINLSEVSTPEVTRFAEQFKAQMNGSSHKGAFVNAKNIDVKMLRQSNTDMQFYELNLWLARTVISAFGLSAEEFGLTMDSNRATSQSQQAMSKTSGIEPYLDVISDEINFDLIGDLATNINPAFNEIEFAWDNIDSLDELTQTQIDDINIKNGTVLPDEIRQRMGLDPFGDLQAQYDKRYQESLMPAPTMDNTDNTGDKDNTDSKDTKDNMNKNYNKWTKFYQ